MAVERRTAARVIAQAYIVAMRSIPMKNLFLAACAAFCLSPAVLAAPPHHAAKGPLCVRASNVNDYNARAIGRHDVYIQNALGKDRRALRLKTTCIDLNPIATKGIAVHSFSQCVAMGDRVTAVSTDGRVQRCRVSRVEPFVPGSEAPGYK
jgi:hypothetical protein